MKILIIGGTGGIGSALVDHFLKTNPSATVFATYHSKQPQKDHDRLQWFQLDATSDLEVQALAARLSKETQNLDILLNTTGFLHTNERKPEKSISEFDPDFFLLNVQKNVLPTMLLAKHFSKLLKSNNDTHFVSLSARIGSIEDNRIGGWVSYRSSKAALNMAIKTISIEWQYKLPKCRVFAFHPGTTDTDLSKPFQKNVPESKLFKPEYVARCLAEFIESSDTKKSGHLYSFDGCEIPW
ncbi:SDR family NAD(P)-dependent oxidoreductase [Vibrio amylolyticus]|uniref:SDR family NAD(P)-dependent oxidoreductase n=1 Tax=Vibrio amylolyticus TaxID=2847292 RepID=UPI00354AE0B6